MIEWVKQVHEYYRGGRLPSLNGKKSLNNVKRVRLYDFTDYEPAYSNNGGCYYFITGYRHIGVDKWEKYYATSADMDYCPICGNFGRCSCDESDYEIVSTTTVLFEIVKQLNKNDSNFTVEFEYFGEIK